MTRKHCDWCGEDLENRSVKDIIPPEYMGRKYEVMIKPPRDVNWPEVDICLYCLIHELRAQGKRPREER